VLPTFLDAAASGRPLRVHGDGRQVRSFCEVGPFTDALLKLVECEAAWSLAGDPVNIGSPEPTAILDLAKLVLAQTGSSSPLELVPYERDYPGRTDVAYRVPDVSRLQGLIGPTRWPPMQAIVARLARTVRGADALSPPRPRRPSPPR